jgi:hypothetical protein
VRLVVWTGSPSASTDESSSSSSSTSSSPSNYSFVEAAGIIAQETATWKAIVDDTGFFWLYKNNVLLNSVQGSTVPPNAVR